MKMGKPVNLKEPVPGPDKSGEMGAKELGAKELGAKPEGIEAKPGTMDAMGKPAGHRRSEVRLGREVQARIGAQLRAMYEEVIKEGVPKHISDLVRRLSEQDDGA